MALTALAGPVANLVLAYLGMVAWKVMYYWAPVNNATIYIAMFLRYLVLMNVSLAVFNLIPVPPGRQPHSTGGAAAAHLLWPDAV